MTPSDVVAAAVRIGRLTVRIPSDHLLGEVLHEMSRVLPCDAASIVLFEGEHRRTLASIGYDDHLVDALARVFPETPWFSNVLGRPLPPSISSEPGKAFRRSWFYENYIEPAGFKDGMGAPIVSDGRLLGTINMSCSRDAYDEDSQQALAALVEAVTTMVDVEGRLMRPVSASAFGQVTPIAMVRDGRLLDTSGADVPPFIGEPEFAEMLEAAEAGDHDGDAAFVWPTVKEWWRVVLRSVDVPVLGGKVIAVYARSGPSPYGLSARELDVLTGLAVGYSNEELARRLLVSARTIHSHVERILRKTSTVNRSSAAALAWRESVFRPRSALGGLEPWTARDYA